MTTDGRLPVNLLAEAGISLSPTDQLLAEGHRFPPERTLPPEADTLQIRHAVGVKLVTPGGEQELATAVNTVGEALREAGIQLYAADFVDPPADTPISAAMTITYRPSQKLAVTTNDGNITIRSSARTVGAALAEAGIPLIGLDTSLPAEVRGAARRWSDPCGAGQRVRAIGPEAHPVRDRNRLLRQRLNLARRRSLSPARKEWRSRARASATRMGRKSVVQSRKKAWCARRKRASSIPARIS